MRSAASIQTGEFVLAVEDDPARWKAEVAAEKAR
jgi:hypothetical protein